MKDKGIDVSIFRHEDARGVADLFIDIYGNDYPIKTVYNPEKLIDAFEKMDNIPVVARTHEGRIVEQGTHAQLIQKRGRYSDLHNLQFNDKAD